MFVCFFSLYMCLYILVSIPLKEKVLQNFVYLLIDYLFVFSVLSEQTTYP